jgi:hypothetical protein
LVRGQSSRARCTTGEDANVVQSFQSPYLFGCIQSVHDWQLNIHQNQMKATSPPFRYRFTPIHCCFPSYFKSLQERFKEFQIDDIVFDNKNANRGDSSVQEAGW